MEKWRIELFLIYLNCSLILYNTIYSKLLYDSLWLLLISNSGQKVLKNFSIFSKIIIET